MGVSYPSARISDLDRCYGWLVTGAHSEPLSQRLAAIREQLKLLADYL
jgi:hypothetical protein